ncbi:MAG: alpha/beta hydrolase [Dehalococcoidia bacterium]|nr:alpha/beta hydrolase [Dehalococcoidia bacterium]
MPEVRVNDIQLYYEVHGQGEPLVLIMGLGTNAHGWDLQIPTFSREFRVVAFDNRGCGRSDKPASSYSIRMFADDTVGLMDALGIASAHVYGVSMGGMIAQELALSYPQRVWTLVLGATSCGGPQAIDGPPENLALMVSISRLGPEEAAEKTLPLLYSGEFIDQKRQKLIARALAQAELRSPPEAFARQLQAIMRHDAYDRLPQLRCPTLIILGSEDKIIPAENSSILAGRIPGAELVVLPKAGHGYVVERAEESNAIVLDFLRRHRSVTGS